MVRTTTTLNDSFASEANLNPCPIAESGTLWVTILLTLTILLSIISIALLISSGAAPYEKNKLISSLQTFMDGMTISVSGTAKKRIFPFLSTEDIAFSNASLAAVQITTTSANLLSFMLLSSSTEYKLAFIT